MVKGGSEVTSGGCKFPSFGSVAPKALAAFAILTVPTSGSAGRNLASGAAFIQPPIGSDALPGKQFDFLENGWMPVVAFERSSLRLNQEDTSLGLARKMRWSDGSEGVNRRKVASGWDKYPGITAVNSLEDFETLIEQGKDFRVALFVSDSCRACNYAKLPIGSFATKLKEQEAPIEFYTIRLENTNTRDIWKNNEVETGPTYLLYAPEDFVNSEEVEAGPQRGSLAGKRKIIEFVKMLAEQYGIEVKKDAQQEDDQKSV